MNLKESRLCTALTVAMTWECLLRRAASKWRTRRRTADSTLSQCLLRTGRWATRTECTLRCRPATPTTWRATATYSSLPPTPKTKAILPPPTQAPLLSASTTHPPPPSSLPYSTSTSPAKTSTLLLSLIPGSTLIISISPLLPSIIPITNILTTPFSQKTKIQTKNINELSSIIYI